MDFPPFNSLRILMNYLQNSSIYRKNRKCCDSAAQPVKTQIRLLLVQYDKGLHCLPFRLHLLDRTKHTVKTKIIQLLKQPARVYTVCSFHLRLPFVGQSLIYMHLNHWIPAADLDRVNKKEYIVLQLRV